MTKSEKIAVLETQLDEAIELLKKWVYFKSTAEIKSPLRIETEQFFEGKSNGWHNIKNNPEDLPTEDGQYLIYEIQYGDPWYTVAYYVTCANEFGTGHEKVIAWRELPKYEG